MTNEVIILVATFALVFLRAIQQLNVMHHQYIAAALTPYGIACAEVTSVLYVVKTGWVAVPWVGTGGMLGVVTAMALHKHLRNWFTTKKESSC